MNTLRKKNLNCLNGKKVSIECQAEGFVLEKWNLFEYFFRYESPTLRRFSSSSIAKKYTTIYILIEIPFRHESQQ